MQLVAYGAQDVYLTGNPQITFWKVTYRRHTNFAMESIEQTFNGQADFGRRVQCTVSRNGDLAYRTYLQVTLPQISNSDAECARWLDYPGEQLVSMVEVEIGGQRIDRQYGDWMHIWNQLTLTSEQTKGYHAMIGHTTQLTYLTDHGFLMLPPHALELLFLRLSAHPARHSPKLLFTSLFSSGSAVTPVSHFPLLLFSITKSRSTSKSDLLMNAFSL